MYVKWINLNTLLSLFFAFVKTFQNLRNRRVTLFVEKRLEEGEKEQQPVLCAVQNVVRLKEFEPWVELVEGEYL